MIEGMPWHEDPSHPFAGIFQKLKRADDNIASLHDEILAFVQSCKYPVLPNIENAKEFLDAVGYFKNLVIPKRFSVLSGEIVHHLRSSLDHITWHFSNAEYRIKSENAIEFPVFRIDPLTQAAKDRYERKIKGISNPNALSLIRDLQPYRRGSDAEDDPICIVHDMDRFDKHRELAIVHSGAGIIISRTSPGLRQAFNKHKKGESPSAEDLLAIYRTLKGDATVFPQIVFPKFGKENGKPVIQALIHLREAISERVDLFARLI